MNKKKLMGIFIAGLLFQNSITAFAAPESMPNPSWPTAGLKAGTLSHRRQMKQPEREAPRARHPFCPTLPFWTTTPMQAGQLPYPQAD